MIDNKLPTEYLLLYFDQHANPIVAEKMKYFPGAGLERKLQRIVELVKIATQRCNFGLGYSLPRKNSEKVRRRTKKREGLIKRLLMGTL